ncbi:P2X purinoceptor 7-like [Montipora capricornis]|uniref:P2X purinoceptor 7-like n=1 Tax=Montipora foliosa TaxID=591990 RepID=UPI0035F10473
MSIQPYQFEPEYSSSEENAKEDSSGPEEQEIDSLEPNCESERVSRQENASWCVCGRCSIMSSEVECICCQELAFLSKLVKGLTCITEHESFEAVCLNRDVLWTALVSLHDRESAGLPERQQVSNRSFRYSAYRQFTWWVHGYLGKGIWRVIPSCAVKKIRSEFPSEDEIYSSYNPGDDDDDDSDFDSDIQQAWRDFLNI